MFLADACLDVHAKVFAELVVKVSVSINDNVPEVAIAALSASSAHFLHRDSRPRKLTAITVQAGETVAALWLALILLSINASAVLMLSSQSFAGQAGGKERPLETACRKVVGTGQTWAVAFGAWGLARCTDDVLDGFQVRALHQQTPGAPRADAIS